jgi:isopentenyl phosphate kinase
MSATACSCAAVVKFGGSVLTNKKQFESIDDRGFALCIRLALQLPPQSCIVHGAGSFGHFHAARYNLKAGASVCNAQGGEQHPKGWGMCDTRRSVLKLNSMVSSALIDAHKPATPVHPMDSWSSSDAVVSSADLTCVERCLQQGITPVLHGDVIFDSCRGYTVLSGDDIVQQLASRLQPPFVLFVSDVPGVFLEPPASSTAAATSDPGFVTLCVVDSNSNILRLHNSTPKSQHHELASLQVGGSSGTDITGGASPSRVTPFDLHFATQRPTGMRKKLQSACSIAASGVPVAISSPNISSFPPAFGTCTWYAAKSARRSSLHAGH